VSIGEELAQARGHAGLTVAQVSQRTRIRQTIIRRIESGDYSVCGGDFYARGHIRSIAKVVGADPVPLIHEYDTAHRAPTVISATAIDELVSLSTAAGRRRLGVPPGWRRAGVRAAQRAPDGPAGQRQPGVPAGQRGPDVRWQWNWKPGWAVTLAGLVLVLAAGLVGYLLVAGAGPVAGRAAGAAHAVTNRPSGATAARPATSPAHPATAPAAPAAVRARALAPVSATAFGVSGPGQGDNPGTAGLAIDASSATAWRTDWYTSARFGNLYPGTGLLLHMGRPVTVTAARISLGRIPGASLQLRVGAAPVLAALRPVAHAAGVGGVVHLRLASPAHGRYVLIWFTRLPQNPDGTFQASVYNVHLVGRP
jgi:transcriptional regulator with XRE-family HTH domain